MNIIFDASRVIRGITSSEDFSTSYSAVVVPLGGVPSVGSVKDYEYSRVSASHTRTDALCSGLPASGTVAMVDSGAIVVGQTVVPNAGVAGNLKVLMSVPGIGTRWARVYVANSSAGLGSNKVTGYTSGGLAKHIEDSIYAMLDSTAANNTNWRRFSSVNFSTSSPSATPNVNLWCKALDLSWIWFARDGVAQPSSTGAVLIHQQLVLSSWHVGINTGTQITFRLPDGSFQTRTVTGTTGDSGADWRVSKLDSAIAGITPVKTLPAGWELKLPVFGSAWPAGYYGPELPMLMKFSKLADTVSYDDGVRICAVRNSADGSSIGVYNGDPFSSDYLSARYAAWQWAISGGDSGSPTFVPINGECCLMSLQFSAGGGPCVPYYKTAIDAAMTSLLGTTASMGTVDLSGFTTF